MVGSAGRGDTAAAVSSARPQGPGLFARATRLDRAAGTPVCPRRGGQGAVRSGSSPDQFDASARSSRACVCRR
jgi:hypothetical protein